MTVSWKGLTECEGEPIVAGKTMTLALTPVATNPSPENPPSQIDKQIHDVAEVPFPFEKPMAITIPTDVQPGQYILFVLDRESIQSAPISIG